MRAARLRGAALLCALLAPLAVFALTSDRQQPIHIEADSVVLNDAAGTAVYHGNVHFTQGTTHLEADEVTVYSADRQKVDKVIADGGPATFRQRPDNQPEDMRGQARHIEYYANDQRVILEREAHLWQGKNEFSGSRIEYSIANQTVKAKSNNEQGRVQVIIQPRPSPGNKAPAQ
jgi:lipopolysaccharide export system protein LptA